MDPEVECFNLIECIIFNITQSRHCNDCKGVRIWELILSCRILDNCSKYQCNKVVIFISKNCFCWAMEAEKLIGSNILLKVTHTWKWLSNTFYFLAITCNNFDKSFTSLSLVIWVWQKSSSIFWQQLPKQLTRWRSSVDKGGEGHSDFLGCSAICCYF